MAASDPHVGGVLGVVQGVLPLVKMIMVDAGQGNILLMWTFDEYERHERGTAWFLGAALVGAALLMYAFAARNFLFAVLLLMVSAVLALRHVRTPERLDVAVTDRGVMLDRKFYPYETIERFWIVEPVRGRTTLYIDPQGLRPRVAIPLEDVETDDVRRALAQHVQAHDDADEPGADILSKVLKL